MWVSDVFLKNYSASGDVLPLIFHWFRKGPIMSCVMILLIVWVANFLHEFKLSSFSPLWFLYDIQCKREGFLQRIKDEEGEGCNIYGFLEVNKVAGNFHFAPGKSFQQSNIHVHDLLAFQKDSFNVRYIPTGLSSGSRCSNIFKIK